MSTTDSPKSKYAAPALEKGFDILEMLASEKIPMSLAQISEKLKRSKSEIFRMVTTLEKRGYLAKAPGSDFFHISNKLFDLGMSVPPTGTLIEAAYPIMHNLSHATNSPCHMAVASGERMVVVARVESPSSVGLSVRIGHHLDLYESGSGLVLLSYLPDEQKKTLFNRFSQNNEDFNLVECEAQIENIIKQGYAQTPSEIIQGVIDLSYPILVNDNHVLASLTVPYLSGKFSHSDMDETIALLQAAATEISQLAKSYGGF